MRFDGKIALITAVASGIGRATADIMAKEGATIVGVDNNPERLEKTVADLLKELGRIRRRGYAVYEDRTRLDIAGVAAPVFGTTGSVIGCLGVTMPASRFKAKDRARLGAAVARTAGRLTTALAGT